MFDKNKVSALKDTLDKEGIQKVRQNLSLNIYDPNSIPLIELWLLAEEQRSNAFIPENILKMAKKSKRTAAIALGISIITLIILVFMQCIYIYNDTKQKYLSTKLTQRKHSLPGVLG